MYVSTKGLSAYRRRRGMAGGTLVDGRYIMDTPINVDTVLPSGTNVIQDASGNVVYTSSSSLIFGIPNWVLGAAAGGFALLLLVKAGR